MPKAGSSIQPSTPGRSGSPPRPGRDKTHAIAVATGRPKHPAVLATLRAAYANVLVTDEATAFFHSG